MSSTSVQREPMRRAAPYTRIDGPSAWTSKSFRSNEDFTVRLPEQARDELMKFLADPMLEGVGIEQIDSGSRDAPHLKALMKRIHHELWDGRGFLILRGLPVDGLSNAQLKAYYWLLGMHLGKPVSQSALGERIAFVQDRTPPGARQTERGYTSRRQLPLHTDAGDFMGLLCVRAAKQGGLSVASSIHAIYNTMVDRGMHDLLDRLFAGFPYHRKGEQPDDQPMVTPYKVPMLAWVEGRLCGKYVRSSIDLAINTLGEWDPVDRCALDTFDDISWDGDHLIKFMMEPGDLYLATNWSTLHSRTAFVDHEEEERKRLILRIWLQREPRTPIPPEMYNYRNPSGDMGIDFKSGGRPAGPEYLSTFKQPRI